MGMACTFNPFISSLIPNGKLRAGTPKWLVHLRPLLLIGNGLKVGFSEPGLFVDLVVFRVTNATLVFAVIGSVCASVARCVI